MIGLRVFAQAATVIFGASFALAAGGESLREMLLCDDAVDARGARADDRSALPYSRAVVLDVRTEDPESILSNDQLSRLKGAMQMAAAAWRYGCTSCARANALVLQSDSDLLVSAVLEKYVKDLPREQPLDLGLLLQPRSIPKAGTPVRAIDLLGTALDERVTSLRRQARNPWAVRDVSVYVLPSLETRARLCEAREDDDVVSAIQQAMRCTGASSIQQKDGNSAPLVLRVVSQPTICEDRAGLIACEADGVVELLTSRAAFVLQSGRNPGYVFGKVGGVEANLVLVLIHEIGHWLRVPHQDASSSRSVMASSINLDSCLDRAALQAIGTSTTGVGQALVTR